MNEEAPVVKETFYDLAEVEVASHVQKFPGHGTVLDNVVGSGEVYESSSGDEFALKTILNVLGEVQ